jgi:hypothetical protein
VEPVEASLRQAAADLDAIGARWAVIGGLAVSFRADPRFTKDVDLAVAVADDREAENIVNRMQVRGYALTTVVEQDYVNRLATVRLARPVVGGSSSLVDLLFANSGIETEVVDDAERLEVVPGVEMPIAAVPHLIALKILAGRNQDLIDLGNLLAVASSDELEKAKDLVRMIEARGYSRGLDLAGDLAAAISEAAKE